MVNLQSLGCEFVSSFLVNTLAARKRGKPVRFSLARTTLFGSVRNPPTPGVQRLCRIVRSLLFFLPVLYYDPSMKKDVG